VWWDPEIVPGQEFDRMIHAELASAGAVLAVWTKDSVESRWVRGEARSGLRPGPCAPGSHALQHLARCPGRF
jgi:adenylate cyclase